MESYFRELSHKIFSHLHGGEILLINYQAEESDFCRFNQNKIRQAGHVQQQNVQMELICDQKQCVAKFDLSGNLSWDVELAKEYLTIQRQQLIVIPQDPFLHYANELYNSEKISENVLPNTEDAIDHINRTAKNLDLVGIFASGALHNGFANSLGQFNWQTNYSFNFDWSVYLQQDKAVKQNYAGNVWQNELIQQKIEFAKETLPILSQKEKSIRPGKYRIYLTSVALQELFELLNWGGFGEKSHQTAQTPLLKMKTEGLELNSNISITENFSTGFSPRFTKQGFKLPASVSLIKNGKFDNCLANSRSAKEFDTKVNCNIEHPCSMEMSNGDLSMDNVLQELDTGVFISNLWYCNYSDRNNCRMTGMTRFACMWVENGIPIAPLSVMRFDESLLNLLGEKLQAVTVEREHILDASTYHARSNTSWSLPGILVDDFTFTL